MAKGAAADATVSHEETFSLTSECNLEFAATIKLTPDLLDEIRRAESRGESARIKFDSNNINPLGNVIDVGGKEFPFACSREPSDLCDIYEQRHNGDDGHGLLVECGSAWRKLNVERILDESTKNHVKMRSEEAERQLKSRQSIILDPANPSVKNQAKTMAAAAVEGSMRRNWKMKKEPFPKKRKLEPHLGQGIGLSKTVSRTGVLSNNAAKSIRSISPLLSPPEKLEPSISPCPAEVENISKFEFMSEQVIPSSSINKSETHKLDKEPSSKLHVPTLLEEVGPKSSIADHSLDIRNRLISILADNPKGMTLKAIEKVVGGSFPNSLNMIEHITKNIAVFQAPGRYFLKQGVLPLISKGNSDEVGSSPNNTHDAASIRPFHTEIRENGVIEPISEHIPVTKEESDPFGITIADDSIPITGKKVGNESEGKQHSSSESGSDSESESDSSGTGSDSGSQSRSRSKSPIGSGSPSSSDSESDNSSSGKEGSDEDVDIMTSDDDKDNAQQKVKAAVPMLSAFPNEAGIASNGESHKNNNSRTVLLDINLNDSDVCNDIAYEGLTATGFGSSKPSTMDYNVQAPARSKTEASRNIDLESIMNFSARNASFSENTRVPEREQVFPIGNSVVGAKERGVSPIFNSFKSEGERPNSSENVLKTKSKRASGPESFQQVESSKRSKPSLPGEAISSGRNFEASSSENLYGQSSDALNQEFSNNQTFKGLNAINSDVHHNVQISGRSQAYGNISRLYHSPDLKNACLNDEESLRIVEHTGMGRAVEIADKSGRNLERFTQAVIHAEMTNGHVDLDAASSKNASTRTKNSLTKNKPNKQVNPENEVGDKFVGKSGREVFLGEKCSVSDTSIRRSTDPSGLKDVEKTTQMQKFCGENPSPVYGKRSILIRELSDLELGEFREPSLGEQSKELKSSYERKWKALASGDTTALDNRSIKNCVPDAKAQLSPGNRNVGEAEVMKTRLSHEKAISSQSNLYLNGHTDVDSIPRFDKKIEMGSKNGRKAGDRTLEKLEDINKEGIVDLNDENFGDQMGNRAIKEPKLQNINEPRYSIDQANHNLPMVNSSRGHKIRESSSDEDELVEIKGPIKDFLEYKDYVKEYHKKYGRYCSLNKNIENTRNEFINVGHELERCKGRDHKKYFRILEQLKEMYRQHGMNHKQMKKTFILLHKELKNLKQQIKDFSQIYVKD